MIEFKVGGKAEPGGSKKGFARLLHLERGTGKTPHIVKGTCPNCNAILKAKFQVSVKDSNKHVDSWREVVAFQAGIAMQGSTMFDEPISFEAWFWLPRPSGHYTTKGRQSAKWIPYPTVRPDVLKMARAAEDALTGIVYKDDSLIVDEMLYKRYLVRRSDSPYVHIRVAPLAAQDGHNNLFEELSRG